MSEFAIVWASTAGDLAETAERTLCACSAGRVDQPDMATELARKVKGRR